MVSLFSSAFDHLSPTRATSESHRSRGVRNIALSCFLCLCEAVQLMVDFSGRSNSRFERRVFCLFTTCCTCKYDWNPIDRCCVPVARAFRALLTLVSAEPHAQLFRMAVTGIKLMLENRAIPEDVDVNEVLVKVVASIKYQAFGRAALTDKIDKMIREEMDKSTHLMEIFQLVEMTRVRILHLSTPTR
ncbi:hypothetical protein PsorP6_000976 [Peronosclerospora sorghi]|uniref:Uncharacterized protein n=1 Tax=Peronosclerospora sorghi TaxID=230839 RepID=A0ACC0WUQ4_9STRA|nr:hypothetical protein PsorP6_000976 [Peronosclerospora sorghi]